MNSYYPSIIDCFRYVALVTGVLVLLRVLRGALWLKSLIAATLAILLIHLYAVFHHDLFGFDFQLFWKAGVDVWRGMDPYAPRDLPSIRSSIRRPPFRSSLSLLSCRSAQAWRSGPSSTSPPAWD